MGKPRSILFLFFQSRSAARSRADRDRRFVATSCAAASTGDFVRQFQICGLRKAVFTSRSSSEWNEMTTSMPPDFKRTGIRSSAI